MRADADRRVRVHSEPGGAAFDASEIFRRTAETAVWTRSRAGVALSGGNSPRVLYERLGGAGFAGWHEWKNVHLFWADERAVPPGSADSNYRLVRETILDRGLVPAPNVQRLRGEAVDLEAEARRYERALAGWARGGVPRLDLVLLGVGADGHTASLFPGSPALAERARWVVPAEGPPPFPRRLTLTLPVLNGARCVVFFVTGAAKAEIVQRALEGDEPPEALPARGVAPPGGRVYWILDKAAASRLGPAFLKPRVGSSPP